MNNRNIWHKDDKIEDLICSAFSFIVTLAQNKDDLITKNKEDIISVANNLTKDIAKIYNSDEDRGYVYIISSKYGYKIGKTRSLKTRVSLFSVKLPIKINLEMAFISKHYHCLEKELHSIYSSKNINGEWFSLLQNDLDRIRYILINNNCLEVDTDIFNNSTY